MTSAGSIFVMEEYNILHFSQSSILMIDVLTKIQWQAQMVFDDSCAAPGYHHKFALQKRLYAEESCHAARITPTNVTVPDHTPRPAPFFTTVRIPPCLQRPPRLTQPTANTYIQYRTTDRSHANGNLYASRTLVASQPSIPHPHIIPVIRIQALTTGHHKPARAITTSVRIRTIVPVHVVPF